jgi:4-hydroxy-tetrahydrodipicolinate synthase
VEIIRAIEVITMPTSSTDSIQGVFPVIQTPFLSDEAIDGKTLQREVDWLFDCEVDGLVIGMVSEITRLTDAERDGLLGHLVRFTAGRGPVIASIGAESTAQAIRHAKAAERLGADALMATPPTSRHCPEEELIAYFRAIVAQTSRPVVVQDASGYLGYPIPIGVQAALWLEFPHRIIFKPEAPPVGSNISSLRNATDGRAKIFDGSGGIALVGNFHRGISGTMPGGDLAWATVALWRALQKKEEKLIRAIQGPLTSIIALQFSLDAFLAVEKFLLVEQGVFSNARTRGPVGHSLDDKTKEEVLNLFSLLKEVCKR